MNINKNDNIYHKGGDLLTISLGHLATRHLLRVMSLVFQINFLIFVVLMKGPHDPTPTNAPFQKKVPNKSYIISFRRLMD
jgi:hypothetical protein